MSIERMEVLILGQLFGTASGWDEVVYDAVQFYDVVFTDEAKRFLQTQKDGAYTFYFDPSGAVFSEYNAEGDEEVFKPNWHYFANWKETA